MKHDTEATIERILTYLSLSETLLLTSEWNDTDQTKWIAVPLTHFNGVDPSPAYPKELGSERLMRSHERLFFPPGDVSWEDMNGLPYDISVIKLASEENEGRKVLYEAIRNRRVPLKEVRGLFPLKTGRIIEHATTRIHTDGTHQPCRFYAEQRGGKWCCVGQPYEVAPHDQKPLEDITQRSIEMLRSIAFTDFYEWKVCLGYPSLPTIGLTTDPAGVREVFKLRDLPNGASRRTALRHWVESHYRKSKPENEDYDTEAIKVIAHLRGETKFTWNGLQCEIKPSEYDIRRAEKLRKKRV